MQLKAIRPILLGHAVVVDGQVFETTDHHARELLVRGL